MDVILNKRFRRAARLNSQGKLLAGTYGQKILGKVNSSGHVFDKSGKKLGYIDPHGRIYDSSLRHVATVRTDGTVVDMNARRVLKVENPHAGAAAFLLGTDTKKAAPPEARKQFALTQSPIENKAAKLGIGVRVAPSELLAKKPGVGEPAKPSSKPMGSDDKNAAANRPVPPGGQVVPIGGRPSRASAKSDAPGSPPAGAPGSAPPPTGGPTASGSGPSTGPTPPPPMSRPTGGIPR